VQISADSIERRLLAMKIVAARNHKEQLERKRLDDLNSAEE